MYLYIHKVLVRVYVWGEGGRSHNNLTTCLLKFGICIGFWSKTLVANRKTKDTYMVWCMFFWFWDGKSDLLDPLQFTGIFSLCFFVAILHYNSHHGSIKILEETWYFYIVECKHIGLQIISHFKGPKWKRKKNTDVPLCIEYLDFTQRALAVCETDDVNQEQLHNSRPGLVTIP